MSASRTPSLLLVISEDWYVASHRLPLIRAARDAGWQVTVATRVKDQAAPIVAAGADLVPMPMSRESRNPVAEWRTVAFLHDLYQKLAPDVVHHVGVKPVLYGGWAARRTPVPGIVHAFAGMGALYSSEGSTSPLREAVQMMMRPVTREPRVRVLVQNDADAELLLQRRLVSPGAVRVIRGSGVDLSRFAPSPEPMGAPVVILPARMLADKGVHEFVAAARLVKAEIPTARFVLAGGCDAANPTAIAERQLMEWVARGDIEWWGHQSDMADVYQQSSLVVLPSYREGLPKALMEAAAAGRAIVTTDVPGCRDVVTHESNGLLVPARNAPALGAAITKVLHDRAMREKMAYEGNRRAEMEFGDMMLARQTMAVHQELLQ